MSATVAKTWDHHTDRRIQTLHPLIRQKVADFINLMRNQSGIALRVTSALRDMEEQANLYAIGRTTALGNRPVTNAQPGHSYHNYGLAFDVVEIEDRQPVWDSEHWQLIGKTGESFGFEWGGRWIVLRDKPHFQWSKDLSIEKLLEMPTDKEGYPVLNVTQSAEKTDVEIEKETHAYFPEYRLNICMVRMVDDHCFIGHAYGQQDSGLAKESVLRQIGEFYHAD